MNKNREIRNIKKKKTTTTTKTKTTQPPHVSVLKQNGATETVKTAASMAKPSAANAKMLVMNPNKCCSPFQVKANGAETKRTTKEETERSGAASCKWIKSADGSIDEDEYRIKDYSFYLPRVPWIPQFADECTMSICLILVYIRHDVVVWKTFLRNHEAQIRSALSFFREQLEYSRNSSRLLKSGRIIGVDARPTSRRPIAKSAADHKYMEVRNEGWVQLLEHIITAFSPPSAAHDEFYERSALRVLPLRAGEYANIADWSVELTSVYKKIVSTAIGERVGNLCAYWTRPDKASLWKTMTSSRVEHLEADVLLLFLFDVENSIQEQCRHLYVDTFMRGSGIKSETAVQFKFDVARIGVHPSGVSSFLVTFDDKMVEEMCASLNKELGLESHFADPAHESFAPQSAQNGGPLSAKSIPKSLLLIARIPNDDGDDDDDKGQSVADLAPSRSSKRCKGEDGTGSEKREDEEQRYEEVMSRNNVKFAEGEITLEGDEILEAEDMLCEIIKKNYMLNVKHQYLQLPAEEVAREKELLANSFASSESQNKRDTKREPSSETSHVCSRKEEEEEEEEKNESTLFSKMKSSIRKNNGSNLNDITEEYVCRDDNKEEAKERKRGSGGEGGNELSQRKKVSKVYHNATSKESKESIENKIDENRIKIEQTNKILYKLGYARPPNTFKYFGCKKVPVLINSCTNETDTQQCSSEIQLSSMLKTSLSNNETNDTLSVNNKIISPDQSSRTGEVEKEKIEKKSNEQDVNETQDFKYEIQSESQDDGRKKCHYDKDQVSLDIRESKKSGNNDNEDSKDEDRKNGRECKYTDKENEVIKESAHNREIELKDLLHAWSQICVACQKHRASKLCAGCYIACYCSETCFKSDWTLRHCCECDLIEDSQDLYYIRDANCKKYHAILAQ